MESENKKEESFLEKLNLYTAIIENGNLSLEDMESRDNLKKELLAQYFSKNPNQEKLQRAIEEVNELDSPLFSKEMKDDLIRVKMCAFDIAEHLDMVHINNYATIETIVLAMLQKYRSMKDMSDKIAETLAWWAAQDGRETDLMIETSNSITE